MIKVPGWGRKGDKGDTGATGLKGDTGAVGAQGPKGDKGDKGDTGATGPQGPKGDTGATGATGATGPQGPAGTPAPTTGRLVYVGDVTISETLVLGLTLGIRRKVLSLSGITTADRLTFAAITPCAAGCEAINVYPSAANQVTVAYYTPALTIGAVSRARRNRKRDTVRNAKTVRNRSLKRRLRWNVKRKQRNVSTYYGSRRFIVNLQISCGGIRVIRLDEMKVSC